MAKVDELVVNYAIYEDATEYMGTTEVTLPDLEYMTEEISGAGIAGAVEEIITGHLNAMTTTFNFRTVSAAAVKLMEPRVHKIDLRVAQQQMNMRTSENEINAVKHIMKVKPKKTALGKVASASTADVSGEYAVSYYAMYMAGKKVTEIDPLNFICIINGKDYLADVRKALGK
ncbi:MAG: phage major tail tube protein [Phascolarctobacterium sp.]|nr:phage major tail tube protein [Candidatus Phascolarctobacterium caballi]